MAPGHAAATLPPVLIDNSPEREFDDIQPGDPCEVEEVSEDVDEREHEHEESGGSSADSSHQFAGWQHRLRSGPSWSRGFDGTAQNASAYVVARAAGTSAGAG